MNLSEMNRLQLRSACRDAKVKGYRKMTKEQMVAVLTALQPTAVMETAFQVPAIAWSNGLSYPGGDPENGPARRVPVNGCVKCGDKGAEWYNESGLGTCCQETDPDDAVVIPELMMKPVKRGKAKNAPVKTTVVAPREQRNGVKRPNPGGRCAAVWEALDKMVAKGLTPDVAAIREWATKHKQNLSNAQQEFYGWRRWNGLAGKDKKAA